MKPKIDEIFNNVQEFDANSDSSAEEPMDAIWRAQKMVDDGANQATFLRRGRVVIPLKAGTA